MAAVDDRVELNKFSRTHELLAGLLDASRPKMTLALNELEQAGMIEHRRGAVRIVDPVALEDVTCGCYRIIRNAFEATELPPS